MFKIEPKKVREKREGKEKRERLNFSVNTRRVALTIEVGCRCTHSDFHLLEGQFGNPLTSGSSVELTSERFLGHGLGESIRRGFKK